MKRLFLLSVLVAMAALTACSSNPVSDEIDNGRVVETDTTGKYPPINWFDSIPRYQR